MHYLVAYGSMVRCETAPTVEVAMRRAYGTVDHRRMTLASIRALPRNIPRKELTGVQKALAKRHFTRTGSVVAGYENDPSIHNHHWTECILCRKSIVTEPASIGDPNAVCSGCEPLLAALENSEDLPVARIREQLGIVEHTSPALGG